MKQFSQILFKCFFIAFLFSIQSISLFEKVYASESDSDQQQYTSLYGETKKIRILILGNSLTAGYGLEDISSAFPSVLEKNLKGLGYNIEIINAGISGDTTAGGRARLEWSLVEEPDGVIIELGGNDGLRAIDPKVTYENLDAILLKIQSINLPILLTGMMAPPNLGKDYGNKFYKNFEILASKYNTIFYPFFLDGVAGNYSLNQEDRIHPNVEGVKVITKNILPFVETLIKKIHERDTEN